MGEKNKPLSIIREEFLNNIIDLINNCGLPPFIIEPILRDMLNDVQLMSKKQLEVDKKKYEEIIKNSK